MTSHVKFLSLSDGPKKWADTIIATGNYDRTSDNLVVKNSKFNIRSSAKDMREYYFEIVK